MKLRCMKWGKKSLALSVATALVLSVPVGFCSTENAQAKSHSETQQSQTVDGIQLQTEANKAGVKVLSKSKAKKKTKRKIDAVSYRMKLKLDTKKDRLYETVTVKVKNNTKKTVSTLCLRDMTPAKLKYDGDNYGTQNKKKRSKVLSVTLAGKKKKLKVTYKQGNSVLYVKLGSKGKIKPGKTKSVTIRMWTDIPDRQDRFGYQKTKQGKLYALSFCFPYLADNVNGKWINDPYFDDGESRSYDLADYDVTFQAPKSYAVATVGKSTTKKGKTKITAKKARDFAIVACNFMKKDSFKVGKIKVNNYYLNGSLQS